MLNQLIDADAIAIKCLFIKAATSGLTVSLAFDQAGLPEYLKMVRERGL